MTTATAERNPTSLAEQAERGSWLRFEKPIRLIDGTEYRFGQFIDGDEVALVSEYRLTQAIAAARPAEFPEIGYVLGVDWPNRYQLAEVASDSSAFDLYVDTKDLVRAVERVHGPSGWSDYREQRRARVARGVPAGGQFTSRSRPEATIAL